jgi:hypothetical protein
MKNLLYTILICTGLVVTPMANTNAIALATVGSYTAACATKALFALIPVGTSIIGKHIGKLRIFKPGSDDIDWTLSSGNNLILRTDTFFYRVLMPLKRIFAAQTMSSIIEGVRFLKKDKEYKNITSPRTLANHAREAFNGKLFAISLGSTALSSIIAQDVSGTAGRWIANDPITLSILGKDTINAIMPKFESFLQSGLDNGISNITTSLIYRPKPNFGYSYSLGLKACKTQTLNLSGTWGRPPKFRWPSTI